MPSTATHTSRSAGGRFPADRSRPVQPGPQRSSQRAIARYRNKAACPVVHASLRSHPADARRTYRNDRWDAGPPSKTRASTADPGGSASAAPRRPGGAPRRRRSAPASGRTEASGGSPAGCAEAYIRFPPSNRPEQSSKGSLFHTILPSADRGRGEGQPGSEECARPGCSVPPAMAAPSSACPPGACDRSGSAVDSMGAPPAHGHTRCIGSPSDAAPATRG